MWALRNNCSKPILSSSAIACVLPVRLALFQEPHGGLLFVNDLFYTLPGTLPRRLSKKIEFCYTPVHGSWLNMAEIELSVLGRQCLDRRVPDFETLQAEALAWQERRDAAGNKIDWRFTTEDARIKLKRLYPSLQE
ncbi:hypothetical protein E0L93_09430 [Rubrobacter taiwanensis]|uniref:Uncharacterized protein n=1 Tax=Rubrobacter taiwanensis TaxID=185139 RepID=A0A4R1BI22_9ACTN|nr:hypothetical protein E0L93_09430 [Rubrobacter taiwanensis]